MIPRRAFPDEVLSVYRDCGRICIAIIKRPDGLFQGFADELLYDDEEDVYYWAKTSGYGGLYATAEEAARAVRRRPGFATLCAD